MTWRISAVMSSALSQCSSYHSWSTLTGVPAIWTFNSTFSVMPGSVRFRSDDLEDFRRYVFGVVPMLLVPFLEHAHRRPGDLDVQLDVFRDARQREVQI